MASSFLMFLDHTQRLTTVGRTPLDEWSTRRRELYLTTHNTHNRQTSMPPVGFEPTNSAGERPQTYALDRTATGTGCFDITSIKTIFLWCIMTLRCHLPLLVKYIFLSTWTAFLKKQPTVWHCQHFCFILLCFCSNVFSHQLIIFCFCVSSSHSSSPDSNFISLYIFWILSCYLSHDVDSVILFRILSLSFLYLEFKKILKYTEL